MLRDFIPPKDADLDAWATNFDTLITATPVAFGLVAGQAAAFHTLRAAFTTALATATNPSTRTRVTVAAKSTARASLVSNSRLLAAVVQSFPTITNDQLASLGLTVRNVVPTPIPAPVTSPILSIVAIGSLAAQLRYADETTPASRKKPFGAIAMSLGLKYGPTAPASFDDCTDFSVATRNPVNLSYNPANAGQKVWIVGRWQTRRGLVGPQSGTISSTVAA